MPRKQETSGSVDSWSWQFLPRHCFSCSLREAPTHDLCRKGIGSRSGKISRARCIDRPIHVATGPSPDARKAFAWCGRGVHRLREGSAKLPLLSDPRRARSTAHARRAASGSSLPSPRLRGAPVDLLVREPEEVRMGAGGDVRDGVHVRHEAALPGRRPSRRASIMQRLSCWLRLK